MGNEFLHHCPGFVKTKPKFQPTKAEFRLYDKELARNWGAAF